MMRMVRLDSLARVVRDVVPIEAMAGRNVTHFSIPAYDEFGGPCREAGDDIGSAKTRLAGGEVLISKLNPRKPRVQIVGHIDTSDLAVCSGEFVALEPHAIEPRYLRYALLSDGFRQELEARVQSVTRSQQRVNPKDITGAWIAVPNPSDQRGIADFLDAETARIDALVEARHRQRELLQERCAGEVANAVRRAGEHVRLAKALISIEQGVSPQCEDRPAAPGEAGVLKLSAVKPGAFAPSKNKFLIDDGSLSRFVVRDGDVLVTRANTPNLVGLATVARLEKHMPTLLLPDLIYRLRLRDGNDPDYV